MTARDIATGMAEHELLTSDEAASFLRVPRGTLNDWRYRGTGPRGYRIGKRVLYVRSELLDWVKAQADG